MRSPSSLGPIRRRTVLATAYLYVPCCYCRDRCFQRAIVELGEEVPTTARATAAATGASSASSTRGEACENLLGRTASKSPLHTCKWFPACTSGSCVAAALATTLLLLPRLFNFVSEGMWFDEHEAQFIVVGLFALVLSSRRAQVCAQESLFLSSSRPSSCWSHPAPCLQL